MKIKIIIGFILSFVVGFSALAFNLPSTAKSIKAGKIKVGKVTGLEPGQRFHNIHNLYQKKYKDVGGMGHVDRGVCLGCHKANGPAVTKLYGVAEK
jgi:hypothetical protein